MMLGFISIAQVSTNPAFAEIDAAGLIRYKQEGQAAASRAQKVVEGVISVGIEQNQMKDAIGYQGTEVDGKELGIEAAGDKGRVLRDTGNNGECTSKSCDVSDIYSTSAMLSRDKKIEEVGFIKDADGTITDNKGYLDKPRQMVREAPGKFDFLTGSYADCKADDKVKKASIYEVCDEYYDIKHDSCGISQVVEIDPRYNYECHKKREVLEKKCHDTITKLTCKQSKECGSGSITFKDTRAKSYISYSNHEEEHSNTRASLKWENKDKNTIFISTSFACDYVSLRYEHTATFEVKNKEAFSKFAIASLGFDNSRMAFYLNGKEIYDEPRAALTGERQKFWYHTGSINFRSDNKIDLLPYLKEGTNTILIKENGRIHCRAGDYQGSGLIRIETAKHKCCSSWQEEREETCAYLG
jgi:hypothetical protein